ncbi:dihydrodipicolinate synthase family protein [Dyadobacter sp. 32]|uniref:dihydrodipicolinate synthase family protein n=1 Tax=Dyadobacter sp. 32 TaxID=538966 RepID=UPI0011EC22DF
MEIGGLWPALLTPVDQDGAPEFGQLEKIVQLCVDQQLDGLYILGSTGQGVLFTEQQRVAVTQKVMEVAGTKLPVIAQVGSLNTRESIRLAQAAQQAGVYGISTVAPIYYQGGVNNSLAHYRAISSSIDIPFFPYHVGNQSIFGGDARYYIDQILTLPNIKGMKLTTQNLYEISLMHILAGDDLILFSGADELYCHATLCGTVGAIGSFFNLWGEECRYVRKEFIAGNFDLGNRFMLAFQEIINFVLPNVWTFFQKAMILKHGIDIGIPNPPLGLGNNPWQDKDVQEILDRMAAVTGVINH